jgi:hypothetical protein
VSGANIGCELCDGDSRWILFVLCDVLFAEKAATSYNPRTAFVLKLNHLLMVESEVGRDDAPFHVWRKSLGAEAGAVGAPVRVPAQQSKLAGSWNLNRCKEISSHFVGRQGYGDDCKSI